MDSSLRPSKSQRDHLQKIISRPGDYLSNKEKDLIWRFRFCLVDDKKSLCKFLQSVDWSQETEVIQVQSLLEQWRSRSSIDITESLKLLSSNSCFRRPIVREYAVETLARCSDEELGMFLLQLVMAVKYETFEEADSDKRDRVGTLGRFLIKRAAKSTVLANFLFWYLNVECVDGKYGRYYRAVLKELKKELRGDDPKGDGSLLGLFENQVEVRARGFGSFPSLARRRDIHRLTIGSSLRERSHAVLYGNYVRADNGA